MRLRIVMVLLLSMVLCLQASAFFNVSPIPFVEDAKADAYAYDPNSLIYYFNQTYSALNWAEDISQGYPHWKIYGGLFMGVNTTQDLTKLIDELGKTATDLTNRTALMFLSAYAMKYGIERQGAIQDALGNMTFTSGGLPIMRAQNDWQPSSKFMLLGFYWSQKYNYATASWNINNAWGNFSQAIQNSDNHGALFSVTNSSTWTSDARWYDGMASTIDSCLIFYQYLNITEALNLASILWENLNQNKYTGWWHPTLEYWSYTDDLTDVAYETAVDSWEIFALLHFFNASIPNYDRIFKDSANRYVANSWKSPQMLNGSNSPAYITVHEYVGDSQGRMPEHLSGLYSLQGLCFDGWSAGNQSEFKNMLLGNGTYDPAWKLLMDSDSHMYNPATYLFKGYGGEGSASQWHTISKAMPVWFYYSMVPQTTTLNYSMVELCYLDYINAPLDINMFGINMTTRTVRVSVKSAGIMTFIWGTTPFNYTFPSGGTFDLQFAEDWNSIIAGGTSSANTDSSVIGIAFYLNGSQSITPNSTTLTNGETYNFTATQYYENVSGIWTFSNWLVNGTDTYTTLSIYPTITGNTTLYITYIPYSYTPPEYTYLPDQFLRGTTTLDYYMRHDTHTINGQYAYILNQTQSPISHSITTSILSDTLETAAWGFRFYLTYNDNSTQELSVGTPTAIMTRTTNGSTLQTSTWLSPYLDWGTGNVALTAIRTDIYIRFGTGTWQLASTYSTSLLAYRGLMNTTWTIYLYTEYTITQPSNYNLTATTRWGSTAYTSGINGITFVNALPYELMLDKAKNGDIIGFLLLPYIALAGPIFYGLILLILFYPIYKRTQSFTLILALLMLLGGAGGAFLSNLIPTAGFQWGWILFSFGLAGFMYKIIRSTGGG